MEIDEFVILNEMWKGRGNNIYGAGGGKTVETWWRKNS